MLLQGAIQSIKALKEPCYINLYTKLIYRVAEINFSLILLNDSKKLSFNNLFT